MFPANDIKADFTPTFLELKEMRSIIAAHELCICRSLFKDKILIRASPQGPAGSLTEVCVLPPASLDAYRWEDKAWGLRLTDIQSPDNKDGFFCHSVFLPIKLAF